MNVLQQIRRFVRGLVVLALLCLVIEQALYLIVVPGYFWNLVTSPVLWGLVSGGCFFQLWRFNQKYQDKHLSSNAREQRAPDLSCFSDGDINPTTGFYMSGGVDAAGYLYGQRPLIR